MHLGRPSCLSYISLKDGRANVGPSYGRAGPRHGETAGRGPAPEPERRGPARATLRAPLSAWSYWGNADTLGGCEKGDANRSARVERPFAFIEGNFLAGRTFADWAALNREARQWCDKVNAAPKRPLHASPRELFAAEAPHLRPLPVWIPEVYALHQRLVDVEGFVTLHTNRYSAPFRLIGRRLEVRETPDRVELFDGPRQVAAHAKVIDPLSARVWLPAHRPPRGEGASARRCPLEEEALLRAAPELADYLARLKQHAPARGIRDVRRLARLVHDYPRAPLRAAIATATRYGLYDLERVERMLLRMLARDFFRVPPDDPDDPEDPEDDDD